MWPDVTANVHTENDVIDTNDSTGVSGSLLQV